MYNNDSPSQYFTNFLNLLGEFVQLKGREDWSGGLDTYGDRDGLCSLYTTHKNTYKIMFHVSTMLKYDEDDRQQIQRKRHIGNDIVVIIYQEEISHPETLNSHLYSNIDKSFSPGSITSKFNHIYIIVRRLSLMDENNLPLYGVSVTRKCGVPTILPHIPIVRQFHHDITFRNWLIQKCINADRSAQFAESFAKARHRAREGLLQTLFSQLPHSSDD